VERAFFFPAEGRRFYPWDVVKTVKLQEHYLYYDSSTCNINWPSGDKLRRCLWSRVYHISATRYGEQNTERLWIVASGDCTAHSNHRSVLRSAIYLRGKPVITLHFRATEILTQMLRRLLRVPEIAITYIIMFLGLATSDN